MQLNTLNNAIGSVKTKSTKYDGLTPALVAYNGKVLACSARNEHCANTMLSGEANSNFLKTILK